MAPMGLVVIFPRFPNFDVSVVGLPECQSLMVVADTS